jgi:hypothetical protein
MRVCEISRGGSVAARRLVQNSVCSQLLDVQCGPLKKCAVTLTEPAVALPSGSSLHETDPIDVHPVGQAMGSLVCASTAVQCGRKTARSCKLVVTMPVQTRAISG